MMAVLPVLSGCVPWTYDPRDDAAGGRLVSSDSVLRFQASVREPTAAVEHVTLLNDGDAPALVWNYSSVRGDAAFRVDASLPAMVRIPPHDEFDIPVSFRPDRDGQYEGEIEIFRESGDPIVVRLEGEGTAPRIAVYPTSVRDTAVGCQSPATLRLRNDGSEPLAIKLEASESEAFSLMGMMPAEVSPGGDVTLPLQFHPEQAGLSRGLFRFSSNSPGQESLTVAVQGNGVDGDRVDDRWRYAVGDGLSVLVLADLGDAPAWTSRFSDELPMMLDALDRRGVGWRVSATSTEAICPSFDVGFGEATQPRHEVLGGLRATLWNGTSGAYADRLVDLAARVVSSDDTCFGDFIVAEQPVIVVVADDGDDASSEAAANLLRNSDSDVHFVAFVPRGACGGQTSRYDGLVAETQGVAGDLCDADWSDTWDAVAWRAAEWEGGPTTFRLSATPRTGTLTVAVDGRVSTGFSYEPFSRIISFREPVPAGAEIVASYLPDDACPD
jgi:hypothetical protein